MSLGYHSELIDSKKNKITNIKKRGAYLCRLFSHSMNSRITSLVETNNDDIFYI